VIGSDTDWYVPDATDPSRSIHLDECVIGGTFFSRRGPIEAAGGWQPGYAEDRQLFEGISGREATLQMDARTYVYHRDSPDSRCGHPGAGSEYATEDSGQGKGLFPFLRVP
jgi:hypothetical protein